MSDITISVPDEWAGVVHPGVVEDAKLGILKWAICSSASRIRGLCEHSWTDIVGERIPRFIREFERLQSLTEAVRALAREKGGRAGRQAHRDRGRK